MRIIVIVTKTLFGQSALNNISKKNSLMWNVTWTNGSKEDCKLVFVSEKKNIL